MRKFYLSLATAIACGTAVMAETKVATFEEINLGENVYDMGKNAGGKFTSGGFEFYNSYNTSDYGEYYGGFAISKSTSSAFDDATYAVDQFNSCAGTGAGKSETYAVCYWSTFDPVSIKSVDGKVFTPDSISLTNAAYAFNNMRFGNAYSRAFTEDDFFTLDFVGYRNGEPTGSSVTVSLAEGGKLLFTWIGVDLADLGEVDEIRFNMNSTDVGDWGIKTPTYFCIDNFKASVGAEDAAISAKETSVQTMITEVYSADGKELGTFTPGLNIVKMSDGTTRKIYK